MFHVVDESKTGEAYLSQVTRLLLTAERAHERLFDGVVPPVIHFEMEFPVPRGRVDALVIHDDGSATVCEIKDGTQGMQSVLAGIGQVIAYAVQVGMSRGVVNGIRKALLFSRTPSIMDDILIVEACEAAGVLPVAMGSVREHKESLEKIRLAATENHA